MSYLLIQLRFILVYVFFKPLNVWRCFRSFIAQDQHLSKLDLIWLVNLFDQKYLNDYSFHDMFSQVNYESFVQVTALSTVEAKKRFEFLEAVSGTMDAHLRYFKQVGIFVKLFFSYNLFQLAQVQFFTCRGTSCCTKWSRILTRFRITCLYTYFLV